MNNYFMQEAITSVLSTTGMLVGLGFLIVLIVLGMLVPWFIYRSKVYLKRCFIELERLNRV